MTITVIRQIMSAFAMVGSIAVIPFVFDAHRVLVLPLCIVAGIALAFIFPHPPPR